MKHIKIIALSLIVLFCFVYPVVSAHVNSTGNASHITDGDNISLSTQNSLTKKYPNLKIEGETRYHQGDIMRFHVTFNPALRSPINVDIDGDFYTTSVSSTSGQFYIDFDGHSKDLSPGRHYIHVEYPGDSEWYYYTSALSFYIEE